MNIYGPRLIIFVLLSFELIDVDPQKVLIIKFVIRQYQTSKTNTRILTNNKEINRLKLETKINMKTIEAWFVGRTNGGSLRNE